MVQARGAPLEVFENFDEQGTRVSADIGLDVDPGHGVIEAQLFGRGSGCAVAARAAALAGSGGGVGQKVELGILANAPDQAGAWGQIFQSGFVGVAVIDKDAELAVSAVGIGIEGLAQGSDLLGGAERETSA